MHDLLADTTESPILHFDRFPLKHGFQADHIGPFEVVRSLGVYQLWCGFDIRVSIFNTQFISVSVSSTLTAQRSLYIIADILRSLVFVILAVFCIW